MWALDTNTLIYFFKGEGRVAQRLLEHSPGDIALPTIVLYELEVGIAKSSSPEKRSRQLAELVAAVRVLPFQQAEAKAAADIRASLEKRGTPIGPYDLLIAGTAMANGATLVTRNIKEFERINTLRLENWFE
jgi:tRNA(fMet)-specific endonuclease VapC